MISLTARVAGVLTLAASLTALTGCAGGVEQAQLDGGGVRRPHGKVDARRAAVSPQGPGPAGLQRGVGGVSHGAPASGWRGAAA